MNQEEFKQLFINFYKHLSTICVVKEGRIIAIKENIPEKVIYNQIFDVLDTLEIILQDYLNIRLEDILNNNNRSIKK